MERYKVPPWKHLYLGFMGLLQGLPSGNVRSGLGPQSSACSVISLFSALTEIHIYHRLLQQVARENQKGKKKNLDRYECCEISTDAE